MKRSGALFLLAVLVVSSLTAPLGVATHHLPTEDLGLPEPPHIEDDEEILRTGIIPVDNGQREALRTANGTLVGSFRTLEGAHENATRLVPLGVVPLFRNGTGLDGGHGGFGPWRHYNDEVWNTTRFAAKDGDWGIHTGNQEGSYPKLANSVLLTPELDLRTGAVDGHTGDVQPTVGEILRAAEQQKAPQIPLNQGDIENLGGIEDADIPIGTLTDDTNQEIKAVWSQEVQGTLLPLAGFAHDLGLGNMWTVLHGIDDHPLVKQANNLIPIGWEPGGVVNPKDSLLTFQFDAQFNLAHRRDGVQVVLCSRPPNEEIHFSYPSATCGVVEPMPLGQETGGFAEADGGFGSIEDALFPLYVERGYSHNSVEAFSQTGAAFSGFQEWRKYGIDLTPWAEESVWVGFVFKSMQAGPDYFDDGSLFNTGVDFRGFSLDNLLLTAPAPTSNLRIRPVLEPTFVPPSRSIPTIGPDQPVPVQAEIVNAGLSEYQAEVRVQLYERFESGEPDFVHDVSEELVEVFTLPPGGGVELSLRFPGLPVDEYVAVIEAVRVGPDLGDDPTPEDNTLWHSFDVAVVEAIDVTSITRADSTMPPGEPLTLVGTVANQGTVTTTATLEALAIDVASGEEVDGVVRGGDVLQQVQVPPRQTASVEWTVQTERSGQYQLLIREKTAATPPAPSQAWRVLAQDRDDALVAKKLATEAEIEPDGFLLAEESWSLVEPQTFQLWGDTSSYGVKFNGFDQPPRLASLRALYDDENLYLAFSVDTREAAPEDEYWFLFDDDADRNADILAEEAVRVSEALLDHSDGIEEIWRDLEFVGLGDSLDEMWQSGPSQDGRVGTQFHPTQQSYTIEMVRPINGTGDEVTTKQLFEDEVVTVDSPGDVGTHTSIARIGDWPAISYVDEGAGHLKYARFNETLGWTNETVDGSGDVAGNTSLAEVDGHPAISYYNATSGDLMYAAYNGTAWNISTVDADDDVGRFSSLTVIDGRPVISYYNATETSLEIAQWNGSAWALQTIDDTGDVGRHSSIAVLAGEPAVSYYNATSGALQYAERVGGTWSIQSVDDAGDVGRHSSIAVLAGEPAVSYYNASSGALQYAERVGGTWSIQSVDDAGDVGRYSSITNIGVWPAISYYNATDGSLKLAQNGTDGWAVETIYNGFAGGGSDVGRYSSITDWRLDGFPAISFYNATSGDLMLFERVKLLSRDLQVSEGDDVAFHIQYTDARLGKSFYFPHAGRALDGAGLVPADGSLSDEMAEWQTLRLESADPQQSALSDTHFLSPGFGIGRGAPPLFVETFDKCPVGKAWGQEGRTGPDKTGGSIDENETWNCGPYGRDGRNVMWEGLDPDDCSSDCQESQVGSLYSVGANGISQKIHANGETISTENPDEIMGEGYPRVLVTPPLRIPGDVQEPYLQLYHQYSTEVHIADKAGRLPIVSGDDDTIEAHNISVRSVGRVSVQVLDEQTNTWGTPILMIPEDKYTTEQKVGIHDPTKGARPFVHSTPREDPQSMCDTVAGSGSDQTIHPDFCGWWWPDGFQKYYQAPGDTLPLGGEFDGSPWTLDRLPLFGRHGRYQTEDLVLQDQTVRFRFVYFGSTTSEQEETEWGWRIGGLAVTESERFGRDVAVQGVHLETIYDPNEVGVGPGVATPVVVNITNSGQEQATNIEVEMEGVDLFHPDGPELCSASVQVPGFLDPGDSRDVVVGCELKEEHLDHNLTISARVTAEGDDFPSNNHWLLDETYRVKEHVDLAVHTWVEPLTAAPDANRRLFVDVENQGNVEVSDFTIDLAVGRLEGLQRTTLSETKVTWQFAGTIGLGERVGIDDPGLDPTTPIDPENSLTFQPGEPGTFETLVEITKAGDSDPDNDADRFSFESRQILYRDGLEGVPEIPAPGLVSGAVRPDDSGVWNVVSGGFESAKRLFAGSLENGEIPTSTDAVVELPSVDLTTMREATLNMRHNFTLEEGYDGGRLEASVDGGETWEIVPPVSTGALPDGYPSVDLIGSSPLLGGEPRARAAAFTGTSTDITGTDDGWMLSEFNLAKVPSLHGIRPLDTFKLDGFGSTWDKLRIDPTNDDVKQYTNESWQLPGTDAQAEQRYWWIHVADGKPQAWHIETVDDIPGLGPTPAWRIHDDSDQGYPHGLDSRLVTPTIDLTQVLGDSASMQFKHRFFFEEEAEHQEFIESKDGGVVEVQVFDPAEGTFGPWQQIGAELPDRLLFDDCDGDAVPNQIADLEESIERFHASGYNGLDNSDSPWQPFPALKICDERDAWSEHPTSYVFTGNSPEWEDEEWDLSSYIGKRVRFAFHARSDDGDATPQNGPRIGWDIADVAITGEVFRGQPTDLRFRIGTDQSMARGEWSIDEIDLVGRQFEDNVAVLTDTTTIRETPGEPITITGTLANLGTREREVVLEVAAIDAETGQHQELTINKPTPTATSVPDSSLPEGAGEARGPYRLSGGGIEGDSIPFSITYLPDAAGETTLRIRLLEARTVIELDPDGIQKPVVRYGTPQDEAIANTEARITIIADATHEAQVVREGLLPPFHLDPMVPKVGSALTVNATLLHTGTEAFDLGATWEIYRVEEKGAPDQPNIEESKVLTNQTSLTLAAFAPGQEGDVGITFQPLVAGLYRAVLNATDGGATLQTTSYEFLVELPVTHYSVDFTQADDMLGWEDKSDSHNEDNHFRVEDDALIWGVTRQQFLDGQNYCRLNGCAPVEQSSTEEMGPEGIAESPVIDLRRVPQGQAVATLAHSANFADADGGRLEWLPLLPASDGAALVCQGSDGDTAAWYVLEPVPPYDGTTKDEPGGGSDPDRNNPLGDDTPVFQGPVSDQVSRFDLSQPATAVCPVGSTPEAPTLNLVNYRLKARLHLGLQARAEGVQDGGQGWQVDALSISSAGVDAAPAQWDVPARDGATKNLTVLVTNAGQEEDTFRLELDEEASSITPEWIQFPEPEVTLLPGEVRPVIIQVAIPADPSLSGQRDVATVQFLSSVDDGVRDEVRLDLNLLENPLPDIAVKWLSEQGTDNIAFQRDTIAPLQVELSNTGRLASRPVELVLEAVNLETLERLHIGTFDVPPICGRAEASCVDGSHKRNIPAEWVVPHALGSYELVARVDPQDIMLEEDESDNVASLQVSVVPLERPDLAISDLTIEGAGKDGFVEAGRFLTITVNVTNVGHAVATSASINLLSGSVTLTEKSVSRLQPGESVEVQAVKLASGDELVITGLVILTGGVELDTSDNELTRVLRVRNHELNLTLPGTDGAIAGSPDELMLVELVVRNGADTVDTVALEIPDLPDSWGATIAPNPLPVPPNGTTKALLQLIPGSDATAGANQLTVQAQSITNAAAKVTTPLTVHVEARRAPPSLHASWLPSEPGWTDVPVQVRSHSNQAENFTLQLVSPGWENESAMVTLPPFALVNTSVGVQVPSDQAPGNQSIELVLRNSTGVVANATTDLQVGEAPDAAATWVGREETLTGSSKRLVQYLLAVRNTGNTPFSIRLEPIQSNPGVELGQVVSKNLLQPGDRRELQVVVSAAANILDPIPGRYALVLERPAQDGVVADRLSLPEAILAPDLAISSIDRFPLTGAQVGSDLSLEVLVENRGSVASTPTRLFAFANGDLVQAADIPALHPGNSSTVALQWQMLVAGKHLIHVTADGGSELEETQEDNNGRALQVDVAKADLLKRTPGPHALLALALVLGILLLQRRSGRIGKQN